MSAPDVAQLENRVMLSAAPLAGVVAEAVGSGGMPEPTEQTVPVDQLANAPSGNTQDPGEVHLAETPSDAQSRQLENAEQARRLELVFIDAAVGDYRQLLDDLLANADPQRELEAHLLDSDRDGVEQISEILAGYDDVDAIHLVSHGSQGQVKFGDTWLSIDNLDGYAGEIAGWNSALREGADLLIYGCDLASSDDSRALSEALGALSGCDVAASDDVTGHATLGGDWNLEYQMGVIESTVAVNSQFQWNWYSTLDITSNLILHNTFDTDASDSSGNNYNGTLTNGAAIETSIPTNKIGPGKVSLDGSNDYVDLSAHVAAFQPVTEGTIAVWIYADIAVPATPEVIFEASDSGDASSRIAVLRDDQLLRFHITEGGSVILDVETTLDLLPRNAWIHVAVTVDGSGNKLYVNGSQVTAGDLTYFNGSSSTTSFFDDVNNLDFVAWGVDKANGSTFDERFNGFIDDGRVYRRALSAGDIAELYSSTGASVYASVPVAQSTNKDTPLVFSTANGNAISVDDGTAADPVLYTTLSVTNGVLSPSTTAGLTFENGADGTSSMTVRGQESAINTALDGMSYTPTGGYSGPADLLVTVNDLQSNPLALYTFDNPSDLGNDSSAGGTNNGTVNGATSTLDAERGYVLDFDGADDFVQMSGLISAPSQQVTLAAWVNMGTGSDQHVISLGDNVALILDGAVGTGGVTGRHWDGGSQLHNTSGVDVSQTGWRHVAFTVDTLADEQYVYIDGAEVDSGIYWAGISYTLGADTFLGKHGDGGANYFNGLLDDVRIYDRTLTAGEVADLFAGVSTDTATVAITVNPTATILDQFNATAYNGNDGTQDWTGDWVELDESDGPTLGRVRVDSDSLHVYGNGAHPFEGAYRIANLSGATTATLSFDYNLIQGWSSRFRAQVSTDGVTWSDPTLIYDSDYRGSESGSITDYDISAYISSTTYVRFWQDEWGDGTDHIFFDNIRIEHDGTGGGSSVESISDTDAADNQVAENAANGAPAGITASATDPDAGDTVTYSLDDDAGGRFAINATTGVVTVANGSLLDYETAASHDITIRATSSDTSSTTQPFTITITEQNEAPFDLALDNASVAENTLGAVVGNVTVTDPDAGDSHTLTVDDARFEVIGGQLRLLAGQSLDHEAEPAVTVTITATDSGGLSYNEAFLLTVTDQNEAPTDLVLAGATVPGNTPGAVVGNVTVTDPDAGDSHTLTVDDARFEVIGGQLHLLAGQSLDHEAEPTVTVTITATDSGGLTYNEAFTITVTDQNEAPTVSLANTIGTLDEDTDTSSSLKIADIVISDDALGSNTLTLAGPDAGLFEIVGAELRLKAGTTLSHAHNGTLDVTVEVDDTAVGAAPDDTARLSITVTSGAGPRIQPPDTEPPPETDEPPPETEEPPPPTDDPPPDDGPAGEQTPTAPRHRPDSVPSAPSPVAPTEAGGLPPLERQDFSTLLQLKTPGAVGRVLQQVVPPSALDVIDRVVAPFDVNLLSNDLYDMAEEMGGNVNAPLVVAGSVAGFSSVLTAGYVLWTIRGGWLATSLLAQMPAWRLMDPLVVLAYLEEESEGPSKGKRKDDDDSLESLLESSPVGQEEAESENHPDRGVETSGVPQGNRDNTDQP